MLIKSMFFSVPLIWLSYWLQQLLAWGYLLIHKISTLAYQCGENALNSLIIKLEGP